jgi:hypothetical protein
MNILDRLIASLRGCCQSLPDIRQGGDARGLDRHEAHARPLHRLADRLGIGPVVLLTLQ